MVDMVIVSIPVALIFGPMIVSQVLAMGDNPTALQTATLGLMAISAQVISLLVTWLYYALLESGKHQATWGKRLLGIKIIGKDGQRIGFARASGRFFAKLLSYITLYIGFIMAGFTSRKRALHDIIAETYVVKNTFREGNELPPTPSHPWLLTLVCLVWLLFLFGSSLLGSQQALTPTQAAAQAAATRLGNLAQQNTRLSAPLRLETSTFYQEAEGYRSVVVDPISGNKFTLFLPQGTNQVCCQAFPLGDCTDTGFENC